MHLGNAGMRTCCIPQNFYTTPPVLLESYHSLYGGEGVGKKGIVRANGGKIYKIFSVRRPTQPQHAGDGRLRSRLSNMSLIFSNLILAGRKEAEGRRRVSPATRAAGLGARG